MHEVRPQDVCSTSQVGTGAVRKIFVEYPQYEGDSDGYLIRRVATRGSFVGKVLNGAKRSDGYFQIFGMPPFNLMHQVIAHIFIGPCPKGKEVNHKDLDRSNTAAANLEYVTRSENIKHGWRHSSIENRNRRSKISSENGRKAGKVEVRLKISKSQLLRHQNIRDNVQELKA